jgi:hypothetical protein
MQPTFAELDRIRAAREAKRVECVERLSSLLVKEFDHDEIRFVWGFGPGLPSVILVEAFEIARTQARR